MDPTTKCRVSRDAKKIGFLLNFSADYFWGWPVTSKEIESPDMTDDEGRKWRLRIFRGQYELHCALACDHVVVAAHYYTLTLDHKDGLPRAPLIKTFTSVSQLPTFPDWSAFAKTSEVTASYCMPNGDVAIHLEITQMSGNQRQCAAPPAAARAKTTSLYLKPEYADMTIIVEGERLPAHKNIVCPRSAVFRAMFQHPMQEASTNEMTVDESFSAAAIKAMLHYLYADMIPQDALQQYAPQLLSLASFYQIPDLRIYVESVVPLSAGNIRELLQAAAQHEGSKPFLTKLVQFVSDNSKELLAQQGFLDSLDGDTKNMLLANTFDVQHAQTTSNGRRINHEQEDSGWLSTCMDHVVCCIM